MNRASIIAAVICLALLVALGGWVLFATRLEPLARFTTDLSERNQNQRHNILLAANALDGKVIKPGAVFSFNKAVGSPEPGRGYLRASAIQAGELRPEWGGGVCQLSSTLYNAALLAGMRIEHRSPHSTPVRSLPPGRDAAVAAGVSDLAFRNTSNSPVTIHAGAEGDRLVVSLLGRREPGTEYRLSAHLQSRLPFAVRLVPDAALPYGRRQIANPGQEGYMVELSRICLRNGRVVRRERIADDSYEPVDRVIRIGIR